MINVDGMTLRLIAELEAHLQTFQGYRNILACRRHGGANHGGVLEERRLEEQQSAALEKALFYARELARRHGLTWEEPAV